MAFIVVYDACVLYPAPIRDLLIRLARTGHFRAKWTNEILDECFEAILETRPDLNAAALARTRELMVKAVPDSLVTGYEPLVEGITLPDPNDRHVVAAAIRAGAQVIVTTNLKDFPEEALKPFDVVAQHPDAFVSHVIDLAAGAVCKVVVEQAGALKNPPIVTYVELTARFGRFGRVRGRTTSTSCPAKQGGPALLRAGSPPRWLDSCRRDSASRRAMP